jgi:hypothetical protein
MKRLIVRIKIEQLPLWDAIGEEVTLLLHGGLSDYFSEKGMHTLNVNLPEVLIEEDPIRTHLSRDG